MVNINVEFPATIIIVMYCSYCDFGHTNLIQYLLYSMYILRCVYWPPCSLHTLYQALKNPLTTTMYTL